MGKELPKNWIGVSLKDVTNNVKGKKPKIQLEDEFKDSVPYIDIKALEHNVIRQYADIESSKLFDKGDVAMVWDGARSGWVSKTNFGAIGSTLVAFKPLIINSNYLFYYLLDKYPFINSNARGVGIPHVDPTVLWGLNFPLPPLGEQERIVSKLDTLFAQLETIKNSISKVTLMLKDFKQQVLTQAVTGKLTEEWRKGKKLEDVRSILKKIEKRRKEESSGTILSKINELYKDTSLSIGYNSPTEWEEVNLDRVCEKFSYGTSTKSDNIGDFVVLRMGNLQGGRIDWTDLKFTSDKSEFQKYKLDRGDVLFNRTNSPELVGKTSIYESEKPSIYAGYLIKIWNFEQLNSYYLNYVMNSNFVKKWSWEVKSDGVSQSNINAQKLSKLTIPLPTLKEQLEIVARVQSLFAKADAIEKQYETLKATIETLPQAILHKAFKGELTEQLESDGDARELLKEIQKLKEESSNVVKKKVVSKKMKAVYSESDEVLGEVAEPKNNSL